VPSRGGATMIEASMGICPYARAFADSIGTSSEADAVVTTTICDQMRRMADIMSARSSLPHFLLNLPSTWKHEGPQRLYRTELARLGLFLSSLGGVTPSREKLAEVMISFDDARQRLRSLRPSVTGAAFMTMMANFHENGPFGAGDRAMPQSPRGLPLAVIGGPAMSFFFPLFEFIEHHGSLIVLDGTDTGERSFPAPFDMEKLNDDPFEEMASAYFTTIPHPFRRPDSHLHSWLEREIPGRGVKGVILLRHTWCDIWHAEVMPIREKLHVPLLDLELNNEDYDGTGLCSRTANRIQAFLEVLG